MVMAFVITTKALPPTLVPAPQRRRGAQPARSVLWPMPPRRMLPSVFPERCCSVGPASSGCAFGVLDRRPVSAPVVLRGCVGAIGDRIRPRACGLSPASELAGPCSALAPPCNIRPVFNDACVVRGAAPPPPPKGCGGVSVSTLAEPGDWDEEWTTVCVAPKPGVRYWVGVYIEELRRALHAVTRDKWGA